VTQMRKAVFSATCRIFLSLSLAYVSSCKQHNDI
jgi:hypothetical protein